MKILLWKVRNEKGLSLRELSELSGVSKTEIADIEGGDRIPRTNTLCALAKALNVKLDDMVEY